VDCRQGVAQTVVLESAEMGAPGRIGGTSVTTAHYVGWRFQTAQTLAVERVGGHLLSFPEEPGDIFAALVRLASIDSVPIGAPFTSEEIVATTTFRPPFPSDEVFVPLIAPLTPGSYALVFGTGLFGATGAGALHNGDDQPDIPPTNISSFIFWSIPSLGQPPEWRLNLASHMRFVIEADAIELPGDYNDDGEVDAADYIVWRKNVGTTIALANDAVRGTIGPTHYDQWQVNFGNAAISASTSSASISYGSATVPEPSIMALIFAAVLSALVRRCGSGVRPR
jgi:hypothetical protein